MKSFFKKMAIMLICMSVFLSYMPWNVVFATDEIAETPQNVITEETQGSGEVTNPEEGNTQLENPKSNAEITEELQGAPSQTNEESSVGRIVKNVKEKVQNVLKSGQAPTRAPKNPEDYFIFNESTNTITGYSSSPDAPKDIKIPATINGVNVEHIGNNAFSGQQLTGLSFELPSNLKTIGKSAFESNLSLSGDLVIPNGIDSIGDDAFRTISILSVTIPDGVKNIGNNVFEDCRSLESATVPAGTKIGNYLYNGCVKLVNVKISKGVKIISKGMFNSCFSLENIIIPDSVESIETYAFQSTLLKSIDIPNSVKHIGHTVFGSTPLRSLTIPYSVTTIDEGAFNYCKNLNEIRIPDKEKGSISGAPWGADKALVYWKNIKSMNDFYIDLETGSILKYTGNKTDLTIPSSFNIEGQDYQISKIDANALRGNTSVKTITIQNGITSVGKGAFAECSALETVTIPDSVSEIGGDAFLKDNNLKKIDISGKDRGSIAGEPWGAENAGIYWKDARVVGDFLIDTTNSVIAKYLGNETVVNIPEQFVIDGKVYRPESIGPYAFANKNQITEVNIDSYNFKSVGEYAFKDCINLNTINAPCALRSAGKYAFKNCKKYVGLNLGEFTIIEEGLFYGCENIGSYGEQSLKNVTTIKKYAFYGCKKMREIHFKKPLTEIASDAFFWCDALRDIYLRDFETDSLKGAPWGAYNAVIHWRYGDIVEHDVSGYRKDIYDKLLYNIKRKEIYVAKRIPDTWEQYAKGYTIDVTIPSTIVDEYGKVGFRGQVLEVNSIGQNAFRDKKYIEKVTIQDGIKEIRQNSFLGCSLLNSISIPASVNKIGKSAFKDCVSLTNIELPEGMRTIDVQTFTNCKNLEKINIPDSVNQIKFIAFDGCSKLKTLNIPEGVNDISVEAFSNSGIERIYVNQNRSDSPIRNSQPWGAKNAKVYYRGEFLNIDTTAEKVNGEYARNIKIEAYIDRQKIVSKIIMPDGTVVNAGQPTWTGEFKVTQNGTYVFKGYDDSGNETEKSVNISDIGKINLSAKNTNINPEKVAGLTKSEILKLVEASASDDAGELTCDISNDDLNKVKALKKNEGVSVTVTAKNKFGTEKKIVNIVAVPDTVPGSQDKPAGYVTVTFAKGDHGSLSGELSQHVNPTKITDLKTLVPKVKADIGFKHIGWDKELKTKFDKDTTITATYEALPDVIPGSQDKPEGYVTVTFAKGDHGKLEGETSQHVNPTKITDLKTLAPKVTADTGFKHTGWNKALKAKFDKDTTVTATYEEVPDTVPGSQEKPAGYVTVTFAKGEHGSLSGELSQHVNPTKVTDLKTLVPKVKADIGFKHIGWDKALKAKFDKDTTVTATYEEVPDTVPGSQEKPAGYVTVTFAKGEHGSLSGELSQHVNPTKVTDLKTVAPKVKADIGFKHTGWNSELKKKFTEDTTITATYEVATEKFAITIDPDGGNWNGSTDPIVYNAKIGEYITLPDAPTKEGYTFKYWKGSKYMPGDRYKVEGEHKFTAVWEKKDTSKTDDSSTGTTGTSGTAGANGANTNKTSTSNHAPFTADSQNIMLYLMMSIFSFVLILRLRSQEN